MFGLFGKKSKHHPRLMCALYPDDTPTGDNMITRFDVAGFSTILMSLQGEGVRNAQASELQALGLDVDAAWREAAAATRVMLDTFITKTVNADPKVLAIASTESLARHAALLFWKERPEWNGHIGAVVMPVDRFTMIIAPCDAGPDIETRIGILLAMHEGMAENAGKAGSEPSEPPDLLWRDSVGFEPIEVVDGSVRPGPRLAAAMPGQSD